MRTALNNLAILHGVRPAVRYESDQYGRQKSQDITYLHCVWASITPRQVASLRTKLVNLYQPASVNKILVALRGVLKVSYSLGLMTAEDYQRVSRVKGVKREVTAPVGRDLSDADIKALAKACKADKTPAGVRDAAMIGLWYTCGIRRAELVRLELADYNSKQGKLTITGSQGHKPRTVYVSGGARTAIQAWLVRRGLEPGPLFYAINKAGRLLKKPMSAQAAYKRLKKRIEEAEIEDFSPRDFRRSFVADLLDKGADIATVAKLAGHASVTTTARYDRRTEEAKRKAAELLRFPF